jgi:trehalose 6-phosphate phosphatase
VISGRSRADAIRRLAGIGGVHVIGNHGIEPAGSKRSWSDRANRWQVALDRAIGDRKGVWIENKGASLSVHYRHALPEEAAREAILEATRRLPGSRIITGKKVINVLPREAGGKGRALIRDMRRLGCESTIYAGDDDTDEEVFALGGPRLLGIRVGASPISSARLFLRRQAEIDRLLERLIEARSEPRSRRTRVRNSTGRRSKPSA